MNTLKKIAGLLAALLYIGGLICIVVACVEFFKSLIPIIAALVVIAASVPTAIKVAASILEIPTNKTE